jgi:hypothetical protein
MDIAGEIRVEMADEWIGTIYKEKIRTIRTRAIRLDMPERENTAEIQYTLLGIELKVGPKRFACPDLAAARYMRVFARLGMREFAIPYDITQVSGAADDLETSWQRSLLLLEEITSDRPSRSRAQTRSKLVRAIRAELNDLGAGDAMPLFDRETRHRKDIG